jgi:hypothetical protein
MLNPKITMEAVTLKKQRIISSDLNELELGEKAVTLRLIFTAEEPQEDESLPWIEVGSHAVVIWQRDRFSSIKMIRVQENRHWQIIASFMGTAEDMHLFFKRQKDCEAVFGQLTKYFFP